MYVEGASYGPMGGLWGVEEWGSRRYGAGGGGVGSMRMPYGPCL